MAYRTFDPWFLPSKWISIMNCRWAAYVSSGMTLKLALVLITISSQMFDVQVYTKMTRTWLNDYFEFSRATIIQNTLQMDLLWLVSFRWKVNCSRFIVSFLLLLLPVPVPVLVLDCDVVIVFVAVISFHIDIPYSIVSQPNKFYVQLSCIQETCSNWKTFNGVVPIFYIG